MKAFNIHLAIFFLISSPLVLTAQQATIGKGEVTFEFVSKNVKGSISGFESNSKIDWEHLEKSNFQGSVASKTLDTNNGFRNWSLRSRKYFNAADFPSITFQSTQVSMEGEKLSVQGNLTIKDITKPITISFVKKQNQLIGTTELYSTDYDIKIKKKREDNLVRVKFAFDLTD